MADIEEQGTGNRRRNIWIIAIIAGLLLLCCGVAGIAGAVAIYRSASGEASGGGMRSDRVVRTFEVGESASLAIDSFAGAIVVRPGPGGEIRVVATKKARSTAALGRIEIEMDERRGELRVRATKPASLGNASVTFEVTVPESTRISLHTGAGQVDVEGVQGGVTADTGAGRIGLARVGGGVEARSGAGRIEVSEVSGGAIKLHSGAGSVDVVDVTGDLYAHTGSGSIAVRGASGEVRLDSGSGSLDYEGDPSGSCRFETGSGHIRLTLPAELNVVVGLSTGSGTIHVDYPVDGQVGERRVRGTIGDGTDAKVVAQTSTGDIVLSRQ